MEAPSRQNSISFGPSIDRVLAFFKVDFTPNPVQPSWARVAIATLVSVVGSLAADALLVALGTKVFPSTTGYAHFEFGSYAKLTVIGVIIACVGWPVVTRISSAPKWLFLRMAAVVTLVLFLPDLWIYIGGAPAKAVLVLLAMHVAIAVVTYTALVRIAPVGIVKAVRSK